MKYLLDANIIIIAIDGADERLRNRLGMCDDGDLVTSAVAYAEVAHGSLSGKPPIEVLNRFLEDIPVLPFDRPAANAYASLAFQRASYDRLIAAHALSLDLAVVTQNARHFDGVPGLKVENWTLPL